VRKSKTTEKGHVEGEHIFPAHELQPLAVKWKELNNAKRHTEAMRVLEQIVERSTPMFERLAQYEEFHHTVDLPILVSAAQEKVIKWLLRWQPKKGRLFSWFSKCAKHAFLSELVKVNQYRRRYHVTNDNLEKFYGFDDHEIDKHDIAKEFRRKLENITSRWGDPQEIGAIHFLVECIVDDDRDKQAAIRSAAYGFGISLELSKFFYSWSLTAMRHEFAERIRVPFTEQDLVLLAESYSFIPDLLEILPWEKIKALVVRFGGMRLKIPTLAAWAKLKEDHQIFQDIESGDKDPDSIADTAKKFKKTPRTAAEAYAEMCHILDPRRSGEYSIYDSHHQE
jgi:DNA-directed RNA polymerase specialized sigma24 family protein